MQYFKNIIIAITIFISLISFSHSDTSWIKKKSDKVNGFCVQKGSESSFGYPVTVLKNSSLCEGKDIVVTRENSSELFRFLKARNDKNKGVFFITKKEFSKHSSNNNKIKKVVKAEKKTTSWIKKKEVKENKKKLKEKIKDSKSWITKKSKDKVKDIKDKLKKHKDVNDLPKAEFYFAAFIEPLEGEEPQYIYGYVNSNKNSKLFNFNNKSFYSLSDGIAYFDNKKNSCEVDSQIGVLFDQMMGKVVLKCKKNLTMTGGFRQVGSYGKGDGETSDGNNVEFEFYSTKKEAIAKLNDFKNDNSIETKLVERQLPRKDNKKILLKPNGKYYALLIGNSNYDDQGWDDLVSPINDITAIKSVLDKSYKFEKIIMVKDGTKKQILKAFRDLSKLTTTNDYVLIYYSGHGQQETQRGYWIPVNGEKDWDPEWIDSITVTAAIQRIKARHILLMVDSCYLGSSFKGDSKEIDLSEEEWNAEMANKALTYRAGLVLASGGSTPVTDAVIDDKHSMFAFKFIDILKKNNNFILSSEIASKLKKYHAKQSQTPQYYGVANWGHLEGDFVFVAKN